MTEGKKKMGKKKVFLLIVSVFSLLAIGFFSAVIFYDQFYSGPSRSYCPPIHFGGKPKYD